MSQGAGSYAPQSPDGLRLSRTDRPEVIVEEIARARSRARFRFRTLFVLTWLILVGGFVIAIATTGRISSDFLDKYGLFILAGVPITIAVSIASIFFATIFALIGALGRLSKTAPIYAAATLYVSMVRGTPLVVQIFFVYSALPEFGIVLPAFVAGVFALSFNYGAYMTEIFRAGIQAIPRGQIEAAEALGMTGRQTMQRVVLPQAIRIVIPAIGNEFIAMIKDSALVSFVALQELFWRARTTGSANFQQFTSLMLAALVYWLLTMVFSLVQERLEKRMAEGEVRL
jgi:polar amino acid transport system permease protein